jgi:phytol kinase
MRRLLIGCSVWHGKMPKMWTRVSTAWTTWRSLQEICETPEPITENLKSLNTAWCYSEDNSLKTVKTLHQPRQKPRLVVFDVEGVLIPKRRYLLFEASRRLSFLSFMRMLWAGFLYELRLIPLEKALRNIFKQLRGLSLDDLFQLYKKIPLMQGTKQVFEQLKKAGCKTALISSGLPHSFVQDLADELGCNYAFGLDLEIAENRLTGQIGGDAIKPGGKALILKRIMMQEDLRPQECAVVADDRNNLPMFGLCATKIGYNPDFLLAYRSSVTVKGDLTEIVPILIGSEQKPHSFSSRDLLRESIHISGFLVAFFTMYLRLNTFSVAFLIFMVTLIYAASELARSLGVNVPIVSTITSNAAIKPEIYEFVTAPILFALGIMLALLIFPPPTSYAAIAIFTLGDGFATIFGKTIGRHVFPYNKSKKVEGTIFGFLFASLGASVFVSPLKALVAAAYAMIVESLPMPINDNLTMPLVAGFVTFFLP